MNSLDVDMLLQFLELDVDVQERVLTHASGTTPMPELAAIVRLLVALEQQIPI